MNGEDNKIVLEPCLGVKVFTWSLVSIFSSVFILFVFFAVIYSDYSICLFIVEISILFTNMGLIFEMLGTKLIIEKDYLMIQKRCFQVTKIRINEISGYRFYYMSSEKGTYPDDLRIYYRNTSIDFNEGLCSKKDVRKVIEFLKSKSINRI